MDLKADVLGDVWDQPVHKVTHEHHQVLHGTEKPDSFHQKTSGQQQHSDSLFSTLASPNI